jgi:hypothetical protein
MKGKCVNVENNMVKYLLQILDFFYDEDFRFKYLLFIIFLFLFTMEKRIESRTSNVQHKSHITRLDQT